MSNRALLEGAFQMSCTHYVNQVGLRGHAWKEDTGYMFVRLKDGARKEMVEFSPEELQTAYDERDYAHLLRRVIRQAKRMLP